VSATSRKRSWLVAACLLAALAGCDQSEDESTQTDGRMPAPAPRVVLSAGERELWARRPADRSAIPVLLYRDGIEPERFARHMALLAHAGYQTIALDGFVRFVRGEEVSLPARPLLLTFDGGRVDSWTGSDGVLRKLGFNAVLFVDVGRVAARDPEYLTWRELNRLQRGRRWELQVQSGTGNRLIKYGPGADDVGPFYAYRGSEERIDGWRERVFSDITWAEEQLAFRVRSYRPLAVAPPFGNYGQAGTNDRRIPRELLARLRLSFAVVFTQDRTGFARPGAGTAEPLGRFEITRDVSAEELHAMLTAAPAAGSRAP
jgi:peptidoglycan/xylan/chitin deacetylase (PgdA/CDA1 family)